MVFDHFPPNSLTETIVTEAKATTIRLFAAKSEGWGVGSVYSEKPSGRWGVWPHSVFQLDTYQLSKKPHGQKTCFKGFWLVTTCAASTRRITPEFTAADNNEGSIQGGILKICGAFIGGGCQSDCHYCCSVDGSQGRLRMLGLALHNTGLSCTTFECPTRHSCNWEDCL